MSAPPTKADGVLQWKHAIAGCTAGLSTVLVLQPLDVIKTRLQVQDGAGALPLYKGTRDALCHIIRDEGWRALYAGLSPALLGSGLAWGIYFFAYSGAKERYRCATGQHKLTPALHLLSAAEAGSIVCFVTNPVWVVKTRLQLQKRTMAAAVGGPVAAAFSASSAAGAGPAAMRAAAAAHAHGGAALGSTTAALAASGVPRSMPTATGAPAYRGFVDCFLQVARHEGIRGLYKGLLPSLLLVSHGAIQFAVYEELKSLAQGGFQGFMRPLSVGGSPCETKRTLGSVEIIACGALSKLAASVSTYPSQVVRSRLQQRMDSRALKYKGFFDVVKKTLAREGVGGFYKGLIPNVLRVMPQSALTFLVYECMMRQLGGDCESISAR